MDLFACILDTGLRDIGWQVQLLKPTPVLGRIFSSATRLGKWLGYVDRFLIFLPLLKKASKWADVVHICDQANAVYAPLLKHKPHVVTCHDMLAIRSALGEIAEHQTGITGRIYQRWILSSLNKTMHVACVSEMTRKDLLRITKLSSEKISVVPNGINYPYQPMPAEAISQHLEQLGLADCRPFLLHVGGDFWYKNKPGLLRIFARMVRLDVNKVRTLVLAGSGMTESLRNLTQQYGIMNRVKEVENVTNEQLCALYSAAEGLIFPSLAEGFGWPIIEAQACGCPVFSSNKKPMTEVGGDGAVYFDPEDEDGAARVICDALRNKDSLTDLGFQNAMRFSTEAMISGYKRIYHSVVK